MNMGTAAKAMPRVRYTAFFEGQVQACGVIVDIFGRVLSHVNVETTGAWRDGSFFLDETFTYSSGACERRTWVIKDLTPELFIAHCDDCTGPVNGHNTAECVKLAYTFKLRFFGMLFNVQLDDRVYALDERRVFNRATMKKFGIPLAHILLIAERA